MILHRMDISMAAGTNGRGLNVRCHCMSGVSYAHRFWNYDRLNVEPVWSLTEAIEVFNAHLQEVGHMA